MTCIDSGHRRIALLRPSLQPWSLACTQQTRCALLHHSKQRVAGRNTITKHRVSCCSRQVEVNRKAHRRRHAHALSQVLLTAVLTFSAAEVKAAEVSYIPSPYNPGWEVWLGAAAGVIPFLIGSWEFGKRILIQRRCERCAGSGLVQKGRFVRKCPECGGFFPWQGWVRFFTSTATPGNGGVLRAPRGQTSIFYRVPERRQALDADLAQKAEQADSSSSIASPASSDGHQNGDAGQTSRKL